MNARSRTLPLWIAAMTLISLCAPLTAAGHEPIDWARKYSSDNKELSWKYGGAYAAWLTADVADTLGVDWSDPVTNNSRVASFILSSSGAGRVFYSASLTSPCSGAAVWLACAKGGGTTTWEIHIRNLDKAPFGSWAWYDKTNSCALGDTCFRLQRSLIHEPIHLTFGTNHSTQEQVNTVFTANQPSYSNTGGSTTRLRKCDQIAAQLAYDLRDMAGRYGDCVDHLPNASSDGRLRTDLALSESSISVCQGTPATVSGRLQVHDYSSYAELGANPLEGRTVKFDLGATANVTSVIATHTGAPADNWSKSFSNASYGSRTYTAHFDGQTDSPLEAAPERTFTITWIPSNLC
jgi:hypothetical protein